MSTISIDRRARLRRTLTGGASAAVLAYDATVLAAPPGVAGRDDELGDALQADEHDQDGERDEPVDM